MKKIYEWFAKQNVRTIIIICVVVFALPLVIIHGLYKWYLGIDWLIPEWEPGDVLAYVAGFEALIGTAMLGAFSLWQNERFKEENDRSQERLQKISEEQAKALEHILLIDKSTNIPLIDLRKSPKGDGFAHIDFSIEKDGTAFLKIFLTNITEYPMKEIHVQNIELFTYGVKYIIDMANKNESNYYNPHKGLPGNYNTHVAFKLLPVACKDKDEHFESACPWHFNTNTPQKDAQEWAYNNQFVLEVIFEIENIYGKRIIETISCEFRFNLSRSPFERSFSIWNKELRFEVVEETNNA